MFGKLLRLSGPHQVQQLPNGLLFKLAHTFPTIKPHVLYVKLFHRLNSQEFQTVNPNFQKLKIDHLFKKKKKKKLPHQNFQQLKIRE